MTTLISRRPGFASGATVTSAKTSSAWDQTAGVRSSFREHPLDPFDQFLLGHVLLGLGRALFGSFSPCFGSSDGPIGAGNSNEAILAAITSSSVVSFFRNSSSCLLINPNSSLLITR